MVEEFNNSAITPRQPPPIATQSSALPQQFSSYPASPPLSTLSPSIASPLDVIPPGIRPYSLSGIPGSPGISNEGLNAPAEMTYDISASMDSPQRDPKFSSMAPEQPPASAGLVDANQLGQRGKGRHTCPHAFRCNKGGVNPDGTMVIFERNSDFRYCAIHPVSRRGCVLHAAADTIAACRGHLQKHDKPFKCDLPGCTNRTGFARIDQLNRHKATTRHG